MIVAPSSFEDGRTVWRLETEQGDSALPRPVLWIDGFVRPVSAYIEAIWLALILGRFARRRVVVPRAVPSQFCGRLEALLGVAVITANEPQGEGGKRGEFSATLIRDPLDLFLSSLARSPAHFTVECHPAPGGAGSSVGAHIASNAGTLRRSVQPLDRLGDVATLLMLAPTLAVSRIACFPCREEVDGIDVVALTELCGEADVALSLPFASVSLQNLGQVTGRLGIPAVVAFRSLWNRYRMFPAVMASLYRTFESGLGPSVLDDPSVRISEYMTRSLPGGGTPPLTVAAGGFDHTFFIVSGAV